MCMEFVSKKTSHVHKTITSQGLRKLDISTDSLIFGQTTPLLYHYHKQKREVYILKLPLFLNSYNTSTFILSNVQL